MSNNKDYFSTLLVSIANQLKEQIQEFKHVQICTDECQNTDFDILPVAKIGFSSIFSTLNITSSNLELTAKLFVTFITEESNNPNEQDFIGFPILEKLLLLLKDGKWGVKNTYSTERNSIIVKNTYIKTADNKNLIQWNVSWLQKFILGEDIFFQNGYFPENITIKESII